MRIDGTHNRRLTTKHTDRAPAWSPNGRRIAFSRYSAATRSSDVYVIGTDGHGVRRLATRAYRPVWSPNGQQLAVGAVVARGEAIDIVNANGSGRHRLVSDGFAATWSPDAKQLAYTGSIIDPDSGGTTGGFVAIVNADGTDRHIAFTSPEKGMPFDPAWSPDGREIAFKREFFTGGPGEIWAVQPDGTGLRKLTANGEHPGWSPNSRELVYAGFDASEDYRIYIMRRDGTHRVSINSHCPKRRFCGGGTDPVWHR
jgi:TolB protein